MVHCILGGLASGLADCCILLGGPSAVGFALTQQRGRVPVAPSPAVALTSSLEAHQDIGDPVQCGNTGQPFELSSELSHGGSG